jgi:hypothetical protein
VLLSHHQLGSALAQPSVGPGIRQKTDERGSAKAPVTQWGPPQPDVDADGLKCEKLGFVVLDVDGAHGHAVYIDEDGAPTPIEAFGRGAQ